MSSLRPLHIRFAEKVEWTPTCWKWRGGHRSDGYGTLSCTLAPYHSVHLVAHRAAYLIYRGVIPEGMQLDHLCRNRWCVNPWHLEVVTQRENILRGLAPSALQARQTHCKRGHSLDVAYRDPSGRRVCRICRQMNERRRWRESRAA